MFPLNRIGAISKKVWHHILFDFTTMQDGSPPAQLICPSGAAISSGALVWTPTFGEELVTNGGFDSDTIWIKGAGWSISGGEAVSANASSSIYQGGVVLANRRYLIAYTLAVTSGNIFLNSISGGYTGISRISSGSYSEVIKPTADGSGYLTFVGNTYVGTLDDVSVKQISLPTTGVFYNAKTDYVSVAVQVGSLTSGTQAGLFLGVDDPDNPANFNLVTFNSGYIKWNLVQSGVYTELVSSAQAFTAGDWLKLVRQRDEYALLYYSASGWSPSQVGPTQDLFGSTLGNYHGCFNTYDNSFQKLIIARS